MKPLRQYPSFFLILWGVLAATLAVLWFVLSFGWWILAFCVAFLTPEEIALHSHGKYPPLTKAIRRYLPRWAAFPGLIGLVGAGMVRVLRHAFAHQSLGVIDGLALIALFVVMGWLLAHFDVTYDAP